MDTGATVVEGQELQLRPVFRKIEGQLAQWEGAGHYFGGRHP